MKNYIISISTIVLYLSLNGCVKNEPITYFNQKVIPIFIANDKFNSLFNDSISNQKRSLFSTFDVQFDDISNQMNIKLINLRAANYQDEFSRFQVVQYDDDFNGIFSDATDKVFINTFNNKYLHTINYSNNVRYDDELILNVSDFYYKIKFLNDDQIKIHRTLYKQADLVFDDRLPNIELLSWNGQRVNLYDLIAKGNTYIYHMAYDCRPCLTSVSEINQYKKENPNVNIVGLVTRKDEEQHLDLLNNLTTDWKVFGVSNSENKYQEKIFKGLPEVDLIDNQGYFLIKNIWFKREFE